MRAEDCQTIADPTISCHLSAGARTAWKVGHWMRLPSLPGQMPGTGVLEKAPGVEEFSPLVLILS